MSLVLAKTSSGRMSPVRGRTMKEYDQVSNVICPKCHMQNTDLS